MRLDLLDSLQHSGITYNEFQHRAPQEARLATSFLKDCSLQSPESSSRECRRLRELFQGKDVIGRPIKDDECEARHPYPDPRGYKRDRRLEYFHDATNDLWYKCCEYRGRFQDFATQDPYPRFGDSKKGSAEKRNATTFGKAVELDGIPDDSEEPSKGPLLECNMMENLKHREDEQPERLITGQITEGKGFFSKKRECQGRQGVALQQYAGGSVHRTSSTKEISQCVDIGTPGASTPVGKKYHVFRLSLPDPSLVALIDPALERVRPDRLPLCKAQPTVSTSCLAGFL
mmetsp:Transcript_64290/g.135059  ORF Transcript_64290/g.135059 Transcript_64290/m.135059 type:complete len:288 (-) Transcript_64290:23-886(-)